MADLKERFRAADAMTAPDLWPDIRERIPGPRVPQSRPYAPLIVGLAIATAGIILAVSVFTDRGPGVRPAGPHPNGLIAFSASSTSPGLPRREAIFLLTPAGDIRRITRAIGLSDPSWSADATRIAVTLGRDRRTGGIGVMNADGTHLHDIVTGTALIGQPTWSPDDSHIAYARLHDIEVIDAAGGDPRVLSSYSAAVALSPAWSPDGSAVVYVRHLIYPGPSGPYCPSGSKDAGIVAVGLQGSLAQRLTTNNCDSSPVWSPDGQQIAFARTAPDSEWSRIMVMRADGSTPHVVASCAGPRIPDKCGVADLSWSPDGKQIAFVRAGSIYTVNASGGEPHRLQTPAGLVITSLSWGSATASATPQRTASPAATQGSTGTTTAQGLVRLLGFVSRVVGTSDAVYLLEATDPQGKSMHVIRYDVKKRSLTTGEPIRGAVDLAVSSGSLWVSGGGDRAAYGTGGGDVVYRLNPVTLQVEGSVRLAAPAGRMAAGSAGLWVGAGKAVYLIDPSSGRVTRSVALPEVAGDLAVGPSNRLYVDTHAVGSPDPGPIVELDATTGRLLATGPAADGVSWTGLSPVSQGVWASIATGLLGKAVLLRGSDLHEIAHVGSNGQPDFAGTNGVRAWAVGGVLWVGDPAGRYACADPSTGARRARLGFRYGGVTEAGGGVYAVFLSPSGEVGGLMQITPRPDCLG
jgi:Tol biopolymer transport system component